MIGCWSVVGYFLLVNDNIGIILEKFIGDLLMRCDVCKIYIE